MCFQMRNVALMSKRNPKDENLAVEDRKMTKQFLKEKKKDKSCNNS